MKIVVWQTAYLGDLVLTTPLVRSLLKAFPEAEITLVARPFAEELLKGYPVRVVPFSKTFKENLRLLKELRGYELAVSPHRSARAALTLFLARVKRRVGFNRSELPFLYTDLVEHRWGVHEVERNLALLKPLGVKEPVREPKLFVEEEETLRVREKFNLSGPYAVVAPFSNFPLKEWSLKNWEEFIRALSRRVTVVVTGTESDRKRAEALKAPFVNAVGRTSLRELAALIRGAKLVAANDSAPVHLANALGVKAFTVYTATSPYYGFYPLKGGYLENPAPCSPCSPNPKRCKAGRPVCKELPRPEDFLNLVERAL
ncbi:MAG: glycosyltransferase family 9 protein [Aquificae bacterium]|nr:glycosyltransferase family 9 protein [Aquificota bacterium]